LPSSTTAADSSGLRTPNMPKLIPSAGVLLS
jgi:hypothetical protein